MSDRRQPTLSADAPVRQLSPRIAGRPFALITTKLHVPTPRAELLPRRPLLARLDTALTRTLILFCAPAGFGKTSLASVWLHTRAIRVSWVTLDAGDNDPSHFWAYLQEALRSHVPALQDVHLPSAAEAQIKAALADLINALATCTDDPVICLDDYHVITTESIQRGMRFLLAHAPARLHFLIFTRTTPPFLHSRAELVELRADDLSFSRDETTAYLTRTRAGSTAMSPSTWPARCIARAGTLRFFGYVKKCWPMGRRSAITATTGSPSEFSLRPITSSANLPQLNVCALRG